MSGARQASGEEHVVRLHLWLETEGGVSFGLGRLLLLEEIQTQGSLKAAAEKLGMSYRAAWGKIKASEELLGQPLIEKKAGNRSGYDLTTFGQELLSGFKAWFDSVERIAVEEAARHLPMGTRLFGEAEEPLAKDQLTKRVANG